MTLCVTSVRLPIVIYLLMPACVIYLAVPVACSVDFFV